MEIAIDNIAYKYSPIWSGEKNIANTMNGLNVIFSINDNVMNCEMFIATNEELSNKEIRDIITKEIIKTE